MNLLQTLAVAVFFLLTCIFISSLDWEFVLSRRRQEQFAPLPQTKMRAVGSRREETEIIRFVSSNNFTKVKQRSVVFNDSYEVVKNRMQWTKDQQKQILTPILPERFQEINRLYCKQVKPYMIILVESKPTNAVKRMAIRTTYGSLSSDRVSTLRDWNISKVVRLVFLFGRSDEALVNKKVKEESIRYGDVLQLNISDENSSLKVLYGFRYVEDYCRNVSYILKTTDKTFVNVAAFLEVLQKFPVPLVGAFYGHPLLRVCVQRYGIHKVSYWQWLADKFPDYVSGSAYVMTANLLQDVIDTAVRIPMVYFEDTFFSGIIRDKLKANLVSLSGLYIADIPMDPREFVRTGGLSVTNCETIHMYGIQDAFIAYRKSRIINHFKTM